MFSFRLFLSYAVGIGALGASAPALANSSNWSAAYWCGLHRSPSAVAQYKLGELPDLFGNKNWSLDVDSFAGTEIDNQQLLAGFDIGKSFRIAANCQGFFGFGISYGAGLKPNPGVVAGFSVQL